MGFILCFSLSGSSHRLTPNTSAKHHGVCSLQGTPNTSLLSSPAHGMSPSLVFQDSFSPTLFVKDLKGTCTPSPSTLTPSSSNITTKRLYTPKSSRNLGIDITFSEFSDLCESTKQSSVRPLINSSHPEASISHMDSPAVSDCDTPLSFVKSVCNLDIGFMDPDTPDDSPMAFKRGDRCYTPKQLTGTLIYTSYIIFLHAKSTIKVF